MRQRQATTTTTSPSQACREEWLGGKGIACCWVLPRLLVWTGTIIFIQLLCFHCVYLLICRYMYSPNYEPLFNNLSEAEKNQQGNTSRRKLRSSRTVTRLNRRMRKPTSLRGSRRMLFTSLVQSVDSARKEYSIQGLFHFRVKLILTDYSIALQCHWCSE